MAHVGTRAAHVGHMRGTSRMALARGTAHTPLLGF